MKNAILFLVIFLFSGEVLHAQVAITNDNSAPDNSAMLDVKSNSKGFLPPRMTFAERDAISGAAEGLIVYCTNCNPDSTGCISFYMGGQWINLAGVCPVPVTPAEGGHVQTNTQIVWNWSAVPIATGYKWHTSNNFAAATNMGTATTKTETGLTQGNSYIRYIWAYNACGNTERVVLQGQALNCGTSFTKTHTAGTVAPVTKTVAYGTMTNIPGEPTKCWITRNLGASQQPSTVDDATEAAAGWYSQFNRKQGYKHNGTTLTPNTTWITPIAEDSDWESADDPCSLLLGSAWRIPTRTEWTNVDAAGNWTTWNGPFSSGLQMHVAGLLFFSNGALGNRGFAGYYWSSTHSNSTDGWSLGFSSSSSHMNNNNGKDYGFSIRCLRD